MGHTPSATKGRAVIVGQNKDILAAIATASDVAMAKQSADRDASLVAIKERHVNELKSAKRNHKHRAKRIKNRMKEFEDMDPIALAEQFKNGVPENVMERFQLGGLLREYQVQLINTGRQMDKTHMMIRPKHEWPSSSPFDIEV